MYRRDESAARKSFSPSYRTVWFVAAVMVLLAATACSDAPVRLSGFSQGAAERQVALENRLIGAPNALRLQDHHKFLTQGSPAVGSDANERNAQYFADQLDEFGFDTVEFQHIELVQPQLRDQELEFVGPTLDEPLPLALRKSHSDEELFGVLSPSLADGDVTAEVVFANHGHPLDYEVLEEGGVDVGGRIVLVRASDPLGPELLAVAAERGVAGMLLYVDGGESGSFEFRPRLASREGPSPASGIPLLPIPAATADEILTALKGPATPRAWHDGHSWPERLGPAASQVRMRVAFDRRMRRIVNVIGLLHGEERPNEWVMAGGRRDAKGLGAWDAAAGAAIRLESARIIARQVRRGYRPKRTIAVASWDGWTLDRAGSVSWAAESAQSPASVVAYLSQAGYAAGEFSAAGSHALQPLVNDIARQVEYPRDDGRVYERWRDQRSAATEDSPGSLGPVVDHGGWQDVRLEVLGGASDHTSFLNQRGVPSVSLTFGAKATAQTTAEDSHEAFKRDGDPKFDTGQQLAELTALFLTRMANADVPPLDFTATAETIERGLDHVETRANELKMRIRLASAREAARSFGLNAAALNAAVDEVLNRPEEQREDSAELMAALTAALGEVERGFVAPLPTEGGRLGGNHLYGRSDSHRNVNLLLPNIFMALEAEDRRETQEAVNALEAQLAYVVNGIGDVLELAITPPDSQ